MRKHLLSLMLLLAYFSGFAQIKNNPWTPVGSSSKRAISSKITVEKSTDFELDMTGLKENLSKVNVRGSFAGRTEHTISFPTVDGQIEAFRVVEASALHPVLAAKYPGIKSYAGQGIDDPSATIRFSMSDQRGFHGMILSGTKGASYIDPLSEKESTYTVYARNDIENLGKEFECFTEENIKSESEMKAGAAMATDDSKLRKYRLAMSCTAEYGNIFAGSGTDAQKIANILAQMNITMTRVNGIYERDLAITMELVANNDAIIYYGTTSADPWTSEYNSRTQQVIDAAIGDSNYDIGHNFNTTGGGNAGCIGCVCTSGSKGSAYTGRSDPTGDPFDIDYVAHEIGHQFGGYHTQSSSNCRSGDGTTEVEPGSGSTIMGYAGICASNIQNNSDAYFHYVNIRDISANVQNGVSSGCAEEINLSNSAPTANAGADYSVPRSTAFVLRGNASDPDGDALTYTWEQNDPENPNSSSAPSATRTVGPMFRSLEGTTSPDRYMPSIADVVSGDLTPTWEVIPSVARSMEFALTVRDNKAGGGQTDDDLMTVNVINVTPFTMSSPNTAVAWNVGQTETVTWNVGFTSSSPISCSIVDILLSVDGGFTYPITLLSGTANDGSANITVPANLSTDCRIMVAAADNIFYDISDTDFSIEGAVACNATVPTGLAVSNVGSSSVDVNWTAVPGASYTLRYRLSGGAWVTTSVSGNSTTLSGLSALNTYDVQVNSVCSDATSSYSTSVTFTTTEFQLEYCASNGNSISDEYISRVQLGGIDNTTGGTSGGYSDETSISTSLTVGNTNTVVITPTWTGTVYSEGYSVWIDYNVDGDFEDSGEQVFTAAASQNTSVSGSFSIPSSATLGNTRMRVSMKYNAIPTSCESFDYGEVEDYTVTIVGATADTEAPSVPSNLTATTVTQTTIGLTWSASSDNVGVTSYEVLVDGVPDGTTSGTSYSLSGLAAGTTYGFSVRASDAAGNVSSSASIDVTTEQPVAGGCSGGISSFPYTESFESGIGAWTQDSSDDIDWTVDDSGTPSGSTGPSSATEGSNYLYVESSGDGTGYPNKVAIFNSPCIDLTALTTVSFSFAYHMYGSTMGTLELQASTDGSTWSTLWSLSGDQGDNWATESIDLAAYSGGTVELRFVGTTSTSFRSDMALDQFSISSGAAVDCTDVTMTLVLDNYPAETTWAVVNEGGSTVMSGGSYDSDTDVGVTKIDTSCLEDGCYTLTMNDSYGDGICCSYGSGSYNLEDESGTLLASGGSFGSSEFTDFCINSGTAKFEIVERFVPTDMILIYPNPVLDFLNIGIFEEVVSVEIYTVSGTKIRNLNLKEGGMDVSSLKSGLYMISVQTDKTKLVRNFIKMD